MIPKPLRLFRRLFPRLMREDAGQALPLFAVLMTAFFGIGALVVDAGHLFSERDNIEAAVDAGALAGAQSLPGNAAGAQTTALQYVLSNAPSLFRHRNWGTGCA